MTIGIIAVIILVLIAIAAVFLMDNGVSQEFQSKVTAGLHHWSQVDEELAKMSKDWLDTVHQEIDKVLDYPEYLYEETLVKLSDLSERLSRILEEEERS